MSRQKRKGDGYERELAKWLDWMLFDGSGQIQRMPLSGGGAHLGGGGKADINGTPTIWVEAKRTERFQPYAAMEQAERGIAASKSDEIPVVITRRNRMKTEESLVVLRLNDFTAMYASWLRDCGWDISEPDEWSFEPDEKLLEVVRNAREDDRKQKVVQLFPKNGDSEGEETD